MKPRGLLLALGVAAAVGVSGFWLIAAHGKPHGSLQYDLVERGDLELTVSSTGTLSAVGTVEVGAQVSANLKTIHVDFNDRVTKGQVLAKLDTDLLRAELARAEAEVMLRQAALDKANAEFVRNEPLFEKGYLSETEFLTFQLDQQTAQAELEAARASSTVASVNLSYTIIRSPVNGTVIERSVEEGQTLMAKMETPTLFVIAEDLSEMQIEVAVDESDIGQIREGMDVRFTVQSYLDDTFHGRVRQIRLQPETVQNVVNYTVIVDAKNEDGRLLPGMTATVDFIVASREDVLLVPNRATRFRPTADMAAELIVHTRRPPPLGSATNNSSARVFVATGDGRIQPTHFAKGLTDGKMTEVLDEESRSLAEGSRVVVAFNGGEKDESARATRLPMRMGIGPGGPPPR